MPPDRRPRPTKRQRIVPLLAKIRKALEPGFLDETKADALKALEELERIEGLTREPST